MRLFRLLIGDPRLQVVGLLILALLLLAGIAGQKAPAICLSCPGHRELAGDCLCYHAPPTVEATRR